MKNEKRGMRAVDEREGASEPDVCEGEVSE
jgi:hypothetical protein